MKSCDPTLNRPVPSTGEHPPFMPVKCDRCGHTHNLHGDCPGIREYETGKIEPPRPRTEQLPGQPKFNSLHISHLPVKVDGHSEHLFVAILNGEAVGQALAIKQEWGACGLRMLYVARKHRFMGIGSRLVSRVQVFAHNEGCDSIEIAVHKGNVEGRKWWIWRRFIDDETRDMSATPEYRCMVKEL